jgi:tRNA(fMet)-specific endonuclease VapC
MENSRLTIVDTNILIELYKGNNEIKSALLLIGKLNIAVSDVTIAEIYVGAKNKAELTLLKNNLNELYKIPISEKISEIAIDLIYKYNLSHNLQLPDALIAAKAIYFNLPLFTLNKKDFQYLDIELIKSS